MFRGLGVAGFHRLHATLWGRRTAKTAVLCLHGYSGNARDFDYLAARLGEDRLVVCLDLPGRGRSDRLPAAHYHFPQYLADIRLLLKRLELAEVDIVGTSMGGLLGLALASESFSLVRRLVMNDVGAYVPAEALRAIARNLEGPASFASLAEVEAHLRKTHREWAPIDERAWRELARHGSRREGGAWRLHYDPMLARIVRPMPLSPGLFFWDAWYRVSCPVLLLRGASSAIFPPDIAYAMLQVKPRARIAEIAGAGHVPSLMSAEQAALVSGFLAQDAERRSSRAVSTGSRHATRQGLPPPRAA